jgi:hypothetical protein
MSSSSLDFSYLPTYVLCLSSSAGEQIGQSEHRQAYAWEPEREHKGLVTVAENL